MHSSENSFPVSLVIPVFNEESTIEKLLESIDRQSYQPAEVILVDGGSTDKTVEKIRQLAGLNKNFKVIEAGRAMPGKGRNIGAAHAKYEWLAFTDAGIKLHPDWLKEMVHVARSTSSPDIIYGNYSAQTDSFFEKCAAITYTSGLQPGKIRGKSIVSSLIRKELWEKTGGFPDLRATEDLIFMENIEKAGGKVAFAPASHAYWELRKSLSATYKKFKLYSTYNVWANRQRYWHHGVLKQYIFLLIILAAAIFHSPYWLILAGMWLVGRAAKRIWSHRFEFGNSIFFNPVIYAGVILISLVIDMATFDGWIKALRTSPPQHSTV